MTTAPAPDRSAFTPQDVWLMRQALMLAARGRTHPNPMVGAVVARDGMIVGAGYHRGVGTPHAEADALANVPPEFTHGATVYVTLEPCSFRARPDGTARVPCADRCVAAGVRRVVAAMTDPDPRVSGEGFAILRDAGIEVAVGLEEAKARALNHAYIRHRTTGFPYVTHKAAMTMDGKIAAPGGDSRWVTGEESRAYVHRQRDRTDALVVGIGTVLTDDPRLDTRLPRGNGRDPVRVIIDSRMRLPEKARVARPGTLALTTERADAGRRASVEATGVEVVALPEDGTGRVDVTAAARLLADRGLLSVTLEGGGELAAAFWEARLVSRVRYFVAPKVIGGREAATPVGGVGLARSMADAARLGRVKVRRFGPDVCLEAEVSE